MALFTKLPSWASILITVVAAVIVVGLVSWGTYTLVKPGPEKLPEAEQQPITQQPAQEEPKDEFADWKTYRNEEYGFEFKYPDTFLVKLVKEKNEERIDFCYSPLKGTEEYDLLVKYGGPWGTDDSAEIGKMIEEGLVAEFSLIWEQKEDNLPTPDHLRKIIDFPDLKVIQVGSTANGIPIFNIAREQPESYWVEFEPLGSGLEARWGTFEHNDWRFYITRWQDYGTWFGPIRTAEILPELEKNQSPEEKKYREKYRNLPLRILSTFRFLE